MAVTTRFTGDEADLLRSQEKIRQSAEKITDEYRKVKQESRELERIGRRAFESTRTASEQYERQVEDLGRALKAGKIDQDTYNRAVDQAGMRLRNARNAQQRFGESVIRELRSAGAQFLTFTGIVSATTFALRDMDQAREQAARNVQELGRGLAPLAQLAGGEDRVRLQREARELFAAGAAPSLTEAGELRFAIRSAGQDAALAFVQELQATELIPDARIFVDAAAALTAALGEAETGTLRDIASKGLGVSVVSPLRVEQIVSAAARAGAQAREVGISDEEVLAATAILSAVTKREEVAGTQLRAFLRGVSQAGVVREDTLPELVRGVAAREGRVPLKDLITGSEEAAEGFRTLRNNIDEFENTIQLAREAQQRQLVDERLREAAADPSVRAAISRRQTEASTQLASETAGAIETINRSIGNLQILESRERGEGQLSRTMLRAIQNITSLLDFDMTSATPEQLRATADRRRAEGNERLAEIQELMAREVEALDAIRNNTPAPIRLPNIPVPEN